MPGEIQHVLGSIQGDFDNADRRFYKSLAGCFAGGMNHVVNMAVKDDRLTNVSGYKRDVLFVVLEYLFRLAFVADEGDNLC